MCTGTSRKVQHEARPKGKATCDCPPSLPLFRFFLRFESDGVDARSLRGIESDTWTSSMSCPFKSYSFVSTVMWHDARIATEITE